IHKMIRDRETITSLVTGSYCDKRSRYLQLKFDNVIVSALITGPNVSILSTKTAQLIGATSDCIVKIPNGTLANGDSAETLGKIHFYFYLGQGIRVVQDMLIADVTSLAILDYDFSKSSPYRYHSFRCLFSLLYKIEDPETSSINVK
ncbi:unnamed protein product, partial [Owenia fusiformis]